MAASTRPAIAPPNIERRRARLPDKATETLHCVSRRPKRPSSRARDQYLRPVSQRTVATVALGLSTPLESILAAAQTFAAAVKPTCRPSLVASPCFQIAASSSLTAMDIDISPGSHIGGTLP